MALGDATVDASAGVSSRAFASFETNRLYAPDVLDIEDLWQWESMLGGASKTKTFALDGLDASSPETARLVVYLQGGSDAVSVVDHHVQVSLNGALVAEESFDGAVPHRVEADVPVSLLRTDTTNDLVVTNVGDTGVYSRVFLDRFEVVYPQVGAARSGAFDGVFSSSGTAEITGLSSPAALLDLTSAAWLTGYEAGASLRFRAEAAHRYLAVSQEAVLSPRVFFPEPSARLRSTQNQADYVLVAPRAFLDAAQPLLDRRQSQGLTTFAASLEEITSSFGGGQVSAEAIRDFLSFAYHQWRRPSPRYVLLLGDANYDPRRFNPVSQPSPMPFLLQRTSYIWTASDPALVALNGDDALPDLAIGRLPATTVEQAQTMVAKILDWEAQGQNLDGPAALVADNPDLAGDFEADARDVESSFLAGRDTTEVFLGQIGNRDTARSQILDAFNGGLSLISYVGHGGGAVWAGENILNSMDAQSLLAQPRQPFMLTMNCLNGYFIAPFYESLAEGFLKAPGKGTIAAFSPSGLSLDAPAHLYHRAVMQEITSEQHQRIGDAILAAQKTYAETGAFPELLSLYHLFGDPAMRQSGRTRSRPGRARDAGRRVAPRQPADPGPLRAPVCPLDAVAGPAPAAARPDDAARGRHRWLRALEAQPEDHLVADREVARLERQARPSVGEVERLAGRRRQGLRLGGDSHRVGGSTALPPPLLLCALRHRYASSKTIQYPTAGRGSVTPRPSSSRAGSGPSR